MQNTFYITLWIKHCNTALSLYLIIHCVHAGLIEIDYEEFKRVYLGCLFISSAYQKRVLKIDEQNLGMCSLYLITVIYSHNFLLLPLISSLAGQESFIQYLSLDPQQPSAFLCMGISKITNNQWQRNQFWSWTVMVSKSSWQQMLCAPSDKLLKNLNFGGDWLAQWSVPLLLLGL